MTLVAAYAEGSGLSLLQTGEAIAAVARNPGQFIDGVRALIASSWERRLKMATRLCAKRGGFRLDSGVIWAVLPLTA